MPHLKIETWGTGLPASHWQPTFGRWKYDCGFSAIRLRFFRHCAQRTYFARHGRSSRIRGMDGMDIASERECC